MVRVCDAEDLWLTGVLSLFVASKLEEGGYLKLEIVQESIARGLYSIEELKAKERDLVGLVGGDFFLSTACSYIDTLSAEFVNDHSFELTHADRKALANIINESTKLATFVCYEYSMLQYEY